MKGKINEACEDLSLCIIYDMDRRVVKRTQTTNMQEKMKLWKKNWNRFTIRPLLVETWAENCPNCLLIGYIVTPVFLPNLLVQWHNEYDKLSTSQQNGYVNKYSLNLSSSVDGPSDSVWEHWPANRELIKMTDELWNRWIRLSCYYNRV